MKEQTPGKALEERHLGCLVRRPPVSSFIYKFQNSRDTSVLAEHLVCAKHGTKAFGTMTGLVCFLVQGIYHEIKMQIFAHTAHSKEDIQ